MGIFPAPPGTNGSRRSVQPYHEDSERRSEEDLGHCQGHKAEVAAECDGRLVGVEKLTEFNAPTSKRTKGEDFVKGYNLMKGRITAWTKHLPQYTAEMRPMTIGHMLEMKYIRSVLYRAG